MLNFKRSLVIIVGLLCAICVTACGGAAKPTAGVGAQGDTNNSVATAVPTAQPQSTTEAVKVQSQNQAPTPIVNTNNQQTAQNNAAQNVQSNAQAGTQNAQGAQGAQNTQNTASQNNAAPANTSGGSGTVISSSQVNVNGQMMDVLTTGNGMALYYRSTDPAPGSTCTGQCAQAWPPFIAQGNVIPAGTFQGQITVHNTVNGNQIEYNGHPLYTYSGDKIHEVNGQGINGEWNAVSVIPQKQHW